MPPLPLLLMMLLPEPVSLPPSLSVAPHFTFERPPRVAIGSLVADQVIPPTDELLGEAFRLTHKEQSEHFFYFYNATEGGYAVGSEEHRRRSEPAWARAWQRKLLGDGFCWDPPWYAGHPREK